MVKHEYSDLCVYHSFGLIISKIVKTFGDIFVGKNYMLHISL
jgi:hypothetical protein